MFIFGLLFSVALSASASNCPIVRDEISNKTQTSSTGYSISRYNLPENEYYLPQCTPGGLFERVQCSTINSSAPTQSSSTPRPQCWCVDPVTGISNTPPYFGTRNNTVCSNTILNTTALCEGKHNYPLTPGGCTFNDCAIGPPRTLIVDCFYPTCPGSRTPIHGPECCDYTCPEVQNGCPAVREEFVNGNQTSSTGYRLNRYLAYDESYVPQCAANGLFERVQCTTVNNSATTEFGWTPRPQCWCVDPVTGIPVTEFPSYGAGNDTACTTAYVDTAALCEGKNIFAVTPGSCTLIDCAIGPPSALIVDCFYPTCPGSRTPIHGPECCDYTCPEGLSGLSDSEVTLLAVCLSAFGLVLIISIISIVVICCVVRKYKGGRKAEPPSVNNPLFVPAEEKVGLNTDSQ